jgi:RNA polymerase sigma factor (sigma-70 family)
MTPDFNLELSTDEALIEQARQGNRDAYNELLARHRGRAFAWAKQITTDHHLAEDIVQEALIRAFLKLGSITDLTKFLPWLRTVVNNQAMMKLRRGGPHARERSFSAIHTPRTRTSGNNESDWSDLDTVLHHYAKRLGNNNGAGTPFSGSESVISEWLPAIVKSLGPKEREVFEKHFFEQLSPQEIADHWDTNVNTIHKALSRIRRKAEDVRIELDIRSRIRAHIDARGGCKKIVLAKPRIQEEPPVHPGAAFPNAILHIMRSLGNKSITMAEVMGFSGYAFVLNVRRKTIGAESPMLWDWDTFISNGLLNLGFHSRYVDYQHYKNAAASTHKSRNLLYTLDMIRESVDRGVPALLSNAISYNLALVYGYDDEKQVLYAIDPQACEQIPYSNLYSGSPRIDKAISRELYAFVLDGQMDEERRLPDHKLIRLLQRIIRHVEGNDPTFMPCVGGLLAYDEWITAFENGSVEPLGNASNLLLYGWNREQAVLFWQERIDEYASREPETAKCYAMESLQTVKRCYEEISETFGKLRELFPFPHGGTPHDPDCNQQAVQLLHQAKSCEELGLTHIRLLLKTLQEGSGMDKPAPVHHVMLSPFYSFGGKRPKPVCDPLETASLNAIVFMCSCFKTSLVFYSQLLGIDLAPERLDGPVGFLPLRDDKLLVLMDRRLDLNHTDWQPAFYIHVPDVDIAYRNAGQKGWTIVNFLDKGGLFTDFFIAADLDGNQLIIGSHPLSQAFPIAGSILDNHPLVCSAVPFAVSVGDPIASAQAYGSLFGPGLVERSMRFTNKFSPDSSVRLRFEALGEEMAYPLVRNKLIAISRTTADSDYGRREWLIHDPDGRPIAVRVTE